MRANKSQFNFKTVKYCLNSLRQNVLLRKSQIPPKKSLFETRANERKGLIFIRFVEN